MKIKYISIALALLASASPCLAQDWTPRASMVFALHHPVTFALDGYGYSVTGSNSAGNPTTQFQRYDPVADVWEVLPSFPGSARSYAVGGVHGGYAFVGFGAGGPYYNDLWRYDPVAESWLPLGNLAMPGRAHPAFVVTDAGKIYIGLGNASANFSDWYEYDIATQTLIQRASLPGPARHHPYFFNIGDVPYACFGHGVGIYKDVYRFDPVDLTWTQQGDLPSQGRVAGTQFSYAGKGYALSGEGQFHGQLPTGEFWEYDPISDNWTELSPHPGSGRWAPGSFMIGDELYLVGGLSTSGLQSSMWRYAFGDLTAAMPPPHAARLAQNHPNPFNPRTEIDFTLERAARARLAVHDVAGRQVALLVDAELPAGEHSATWQPRDLPSGFYLYQLEVDGRSQTRKAILLK